MSDIDLSTVAKDAPASASFSASKECSTYSSEYPSTFVSLRPSICQRLLRLVRNGNIGQALVLNNWLGFVQVLGQIGHEGRTARTDGGGITRMRLVLEENIALGVADMNFSELPE